MDREREGNYETFDQDLFFGSHADHGAELGF
jgi:hypothetical protein